MAKRLQSPNGYGGETDHSAEVSMLRLQADGLEATNKDAAVDSRLAADLLEAHDQTGISLDDWPTARRFVERALGKPIIPNFI